MQACREGKMQVQCNVEAARGEQVAAAVGECRVRAGK